MRGVIVTFEAIRGWCLKFGQTYANELRRRRPRPGDRWHLDEVFIRINGRTHYLWRAVDQEGEVLDILVQSRRDKKAAKRYCQLNGNFPCDTATECDLGPLGVLEVAAVKAHIWLSWQYPHIHSPKWRQNLEITRIHLTGVGLQHTSRASNPSSNGPFSC